MSPYCVTVRAQDMGYMYQEQPTKDTDTELCLEADLSKVAAQPQPMPAPLMQEKPNGSPIGTISPKEMAYKRMMQRIVYPTDIHIQRTAQNYSRLAQPEEMAKISKINQKFRIVTDPTGSIGITRYGGILFVRNNVNLFNSHADIFA